MRREEIFHLVSKTYQENKMFESILFESDNQEQLLELVLKVSRFFYCENHQFEDDHCKTCQQFDHHQILDFHQVGDGFLAINKEVLKKELDDLEQTAKQLHHPKILVIANAENLKVDAANALLKFLEEPTKNTFIFLLTNSKTNVLPTIKSRTKLLTLDADVLESKNNFLVKVLKTQNSETILLANNKLKKLEPKELIFLVQEALTVFLKNNDLQFYQLGLEFIDDLKFDANTNLAIDRFLIKASEVY